MSATRAATRLLPALFALLLSLLPRVALAAWPHDPNNGNVPLCTASNTQQVPVGVSDGAGGAIYAWTDFRNGNADIYAQHVTAAGVVQWTTDGVALCTDPNSQVHPTIATDGAGGAIVAWEDSRSGSVDIYAQRVSAGGVALWTANGVPVCAAAFAQQSPVIVSDGAGGAIITWQDNRGASVDIYAQRLNGAGTPQWTLDGVAICLAASAQITPVITTDGAGGAIIAWQDNRNGNPDIFAQRVNSGGIVQWTTDGMALCTDPTVQSTPAIASDGSGGAIVVWQDFRNGNSDIFADRISSAGSPLWAFNGAAVCTAAGVQQSPVVVSDGAGGVIAAWQDSRTDGGDIYAQRMGAAGLPQWAANGVALCTATNTQQSPSIVSDGAGGAIVAWQDNRFINLDVFARAINSAGVAQWTTDGVGLCLDAGAQQDASAVSDGAGGAIVGWDDNRTASAPHIYAQRVARYGYLGTPEAEIVEAKDVPNDQGGKVKLAWNASYLEFDPYDVVNYYNVFRSAPPNLVQAALASRAIVRDASDAGAVAAVPGELMKTVVSGTTYYWELLGSVTSNFLPNYSYLAATAEDSTGLGNPKTGFMVQARTSSGSQHWESLPDSGYSVDNLPPVAPAPFLGQYSAGTASLHWGPNVEPDLAGYRLYRGSSAGFTPSPANRIAQPTDTSYVDAAGAPYYYKLSAVDIHGNESGFATLLPVGAAGVPNAQLPAALSLERPVPNPTRSGALFRFTLPREGRVTLVLFDQQGRRVRELVSAGLGAGSHAVAWDGRDDAGRTVANGLYFARLEAEGQALTARLAAIR